MPLLTQNSKIAKSKRRTFNFGIPAFRSKDGFQTCPMAGICAKGCYAKQGFYNMGNVQRAQHDRLAATKRPSFPRLMTEEIRRVKADRVRIHDSGDFYSLNYLSKWILIAIENPNVEFYAYTKMVGMFKDLGLDSLPANLTIIFSFGGKQDNLIDPTKDRHSRVFPSLAALKRAGYVDASKNDDKALTFNHRVGLIYHGAKSRDWSEAA